MTCAIVLAAGQSRRMGRPKLLLPWGHSTVLASVVDAFLGADVASVCVVIPSGARLLRESLGRRPVQWVENPRDNSEMLESVRCGLRAAPPEVQTFLVSPADLPGLHADLIRALLSAHRYYGASITVPVWEGRRGHPLVFEAGFRSELLLAYDGVGLRGLLQAHAGEVHEWPAPDPSPCLDLDTPQDYQRLRDQLDERGTKPG